jgi:hypothetical protein
LTRKFSTFLSFSLSVVPWIFAVCQMMASPIRFTSAGHGSALRFLAAPLSFLTWHCTHFLAWHRTHCWAAASCLAVRRLPCSWTGSALSCPAVLWFPAWHCAQFLGRLSSSSCFLRCLSVSSSWQPGFQLLLRFSSLVLPSGFPAAGLDSGGPVLLMLVSRRSIVAGLIFLAWHGAQFLPVGNASHSACLVFMASPSQAAPSLAAPSWPRLLPLLRGLVTRWPSLSGRAFSRRLSFAAGPSRSPTEVRVVAGGAWFHAGADVPADGRADARPDEHDYERVWCVRVCACCLVVCASVCLLKFAAPFRPATSNMYHIMCNFIVYSHPLSRNLYMHTCVSARHITVRRRLSTGLSPMS